MMPSKEYQPFYLHLLTSFSLLPSVIPSWLFFSFFLVKHPSTLMRTTHCGCQTLIHTFSLIFFLFLYLSLHCFDSRHLCSCSCSQLLSLGVTCWAKGKKQKKDEQHHLHTPSLSLFICRVETIALSPRNDQAVAKGVHGVVYQLSEREASAHCGLFQSLRLENCI